MRGGAIDEVSCSIVYTVMKFREKRKGELRGEKTSSSCELHAQGHMLAVGWLSHQKAISAVPLPPIPVDSGT